MAAADGGPSVPNLLLAALMLLAGNSIRGCCCFFPAPTRFAAQKPAGVLPG